MKAVLLSVCLGWLGMASQTLTGRVVQLPDSTPVANAEIVQPQLSLREVTGASGNFTVHNVPAATRLHVLAAGHQPVSFVAQGDTTVLVVLEPLSGSLSELVVYGQQVSPRFETAGNIDVLTSEAMREKGALSVSDGIARLPGVSQLTTGAGISKPVIRGLYGNRIQTLLFGVRFDNQQWQDEHGLGVPDIGIGAAEVIKGPATIFYGSEAMGGVLNLLGEEPAPTHSLQADFSTKMFSNTFGYGADAGVKRTGEKTRWSIRGGTESHADYSDGNNQRILNSRFASNVAKATLGWSRKHWISENTYLASVSNFGFIMDAYQLYETADDRLARSFGRPHHTVTVNLFSSQNTFLLGRSKLTANGGVHFNDRQEQEGSGGISLDMLLNTYVAALAWTKPVTKRTELTIASNGQYQTNRNIGSRVIVPDANLAEASASGYLKWKGEHLVAEGGIRTDVKQVATLHTGDFNNGDPFRPGGTAIVPFTRAFKTLNGSAGISWFDARHVNIKLNASTGYRAPNLAELSSNGLHEGSVRYEVGRPDLKVEQNFCTEAYAEWYNSWFTVSGSVYRNVFLNYVYLRPTGKEYLGFRVYEYFQEDASLTGGEAALRVHPKHAAGLSFSSSWFGLQGLTANKERLPFIPPPRAQFELREDLSLRRIPVYAFVGYTSVASQSKPAQFETATPSYDLYNAGLGGSVRFGRHRLDVNIAGNNLANRAYYDHLSRFKYYGINNIGRNISIHLNMNLNVYEKS